MFRLMVISALLQSAAVVMQLAAAFLALRLLRITGWKISWLAISGALCVMAVRRFYGLWRLTWDGVKPIVVDEAAALAISFLMLVGVASIKPCPRRKSNRARPGGGANFKVQTSWVYCRTSTTW